MKAQRPRSSPDLIAAILLTAAWCLPVLWIRLGGDFCLYDDWAYAQTVRHWLETGQFARPRFIFAPTYSNAVIGLGFAKAFGFSFAVLRASTFVVGWAGILVTYALCRQLGARAGAAGLAAGALAANPIYFHLSYTFMTDVAFTVFVVGGLAAFARGFARRSPAWMVVAAMMAVAAVLSRSPGIALPAAMALAILVTRFRDPRTWIIVGVALAAAAVLYWLGPAFLFGAQDAGSRVNLAWYVRQNLLRRGLLYDLGRNGLTAIYLLGLFVAPLVLARRVARVPGRWLVLGGAAGAALILVVLVHRPPPYAIDQIRDLGLGPITISGKSDLPTAVAGVWPILAAMGFACTAAAGLSLGQVLRRRGLAPFLQPGTLAVALFPVVYLGPLSIQWPFLDRWLLPALPAFLALLARFAPPDLRGWRLARGAGWLAVLGIFAVLGTRDQLTLHRTMTRITNRVLAMGFDADEVNAGTGFNGWYHWKDPRVRESDPRTGGRWVVGDRVVVSLAPQMRGYTPLVSERYRAVMPPEELTVTAFLRQDGPSPLLHPPAGPGPEGAPSRARPPEPPHPSSGS